MPFGRLHLRQIQLHLLREWSPSQGDQLDLIQVPSQVRQAARWWLDPANIFLGAPVVPPEPNIRLYTDACMKGWGAHCADQTFQGLWTAQEQLLHINVLEMRAVYMALMCVNTSPGDRVMVSTDNTSAVAYINHLGGTRSESLWRETETLFHLVIGRCVTLRAVHIPGRLNVIADLLSRDGQVLPTEWSLHPEITRALFRVWGKPHIDLFATRYNNKCDVFVSPVPDHLALETDAFSISWDGIWAYAFPPHSVMAQVLHRWRRH